MVMARFCARVRKRTDLPQVSMKDVYQHPSVQSLSKAVAVLPGAVPLAAVLPGAVLPPPAPTALESAFAAVLAEVLDVEQVSVDGHVFDDLGADSMVMARFCARVRKRPDLPQVSMKDIYQHPTVRSLATAVGGAATAPAQRPAPAQRQAPGPREALTPRPAPTWLPASPDVVASRAEPPVHGSPPVPRPGSTTAYVVCGALQLLVFIAYVCLGSLVAARGYAWISSGRGLGVNGWTGAATTTRSPTTTSNTFGSS
jgi:acyl carrier protein